MKPTTVSLMLLGSLWDQENGGWNRTSDGTESRILLVTGVDPGSEFLDDSTLR